MSTDKFQDMARSLGTKQDSHVVLYCDNAMLFSTRVWWCFKYFGLTNVSVLDGGWNAWIAEGRKVALRSPKSIPATGDNAFVAEIQP
jgi:thiosulfate/3-mercaptopyruvate sulfurtransferase